MNEELQKRLFGYLDSLDKSANKVGEFASAEIPQVIQEWLTWLAIERFAYMGLFLIAMIGGSVAWFLVRRSDRDTKFEDSPPKILSGTLCPIMIVAGAIGSFTWALDGVYPPATAFALISTSAGVLEPPPSPEYFPVVQRSIHAVAIDLEILDHRECRYILSRADDWQADLDLLRRRYADLKDSPAVAMSDALPPRWLVNHWIAFNRAYRKNLDERAAWELDREQDIREAVRETDRLYAVWDAVRDARCEFYYITVRRQALKKLGEILGDDDITCLPPVVPEWRFVEIK